MFTEGGLLNYEQSTVLTERNMIFMTGTTKMIIKPKIEYINYNLTVIVNLQKANILTTKYINILSPAFRVLSHWGQRLILMSDSYLRFFSSSNLFAKSSKSTS